MSKSKLGRAALCVLLVLFGFTIGVVATEPTETKEVEVPVEVEKVVKETPESCKQAIETDNEFFILIGEALNTFEFDPLLDKLDSDSGQRKALAQQCLDS